MNKKHKIIILSIVILCAACIICSLLVFYISTKPYTKVINKNWDLELPNYCAKEIYAYSEPSPHGDGIRYHVIDYPIWNSYSEKAQNAAWQLERVFFSNSAQPTESQIAYVNSLLEEIGIGADMLPDWKRCHLIYLKQDDNSELFLFYLSEEGTLYAVESFL